MVFLIFSIFAVLLVVTNGVSDGALGVTLRSSASAMVSTGGVFSGIPGYFASKSTLLDQRDQLRDRIRELELYAINNQVLVSENRELRNLLGLEEYSLNPGVLGQVTSGLGQLPFGTLLVSHDPDAYMSNRAYVFGAGNTVIGLVADTHDGVASVRLLSAPGQETYALVGVGDRTHALTLVGQGNGNMIAEIARDADIQVGDPVILVTDSTALIGYVGHIAMKPSSALQVVRVRTPLNLSVIRFVRIR